MNRSFSKRFAAAGFALCGAVFTFFSCVTSDTVLDAVYHGMNAGVSIAKAAEDITPEQEYYIGRAVAATILESYDLYRSEPQERYVNSVCQVLVVNSARPELFVGYRVGILDTDQINAFATSGGHILVTRGLLACADSEDALAAVLAHEIAHIQLQHSIKAIKTNRISGALLATTGAALAFTGSKDLAELANTLDESVNEIVTTLVNTGYSKSQEYDADKTALALMSSAGYDPSAMTDMLQMLKEKQPHSSGGFASTHPSASSRIREVSQDVKKYPAVTIPAARRDRFTAAAFSD